MSTDNECTKLAYWISKREEIRKLREKGVPPPWTDDPAMGTVRYCNVRREDDKVTRWLVDNNWRERNKVNLLPAIVLARMVNWPDSLEEIGYPQTWDVDHIEDVLIARAARGDKVWSAAYMITTCGKRMRKESYVVRWVANAIYENQLGLPLTSLADSFRWLTSHDGVGSFLAGQVLADLKNTPEHPLTGAYDWDRWCSPGPGSVRGLNVFFKRDPEKSMSVGQFELQIGLAWKLVSPMLADDLQNLHMQDFQNCLCEFSKYMKFSRGGQVRNRYVSRNAVR